MSSLRTFRLLAALNARLIVRGYLNSKSALLGATLIVIVLVPLSLRLSLGLGKQLSGAQSGSALLWALTMVFALFSVAPLASAAALPDSGDPARLLSYPVRPWVLAGALALGTLAEVTTGIALPPLAVIFLKVGWTAVPSVLLLVATGLLFGQVLLFLGGALARSRRVREALTLSLPFVLAFVLIVASRQPAHAAAPSLKVAKTLPKPLAFLAATPPGLAQAALEQPIALLGLLGWAGGALVLAGKLAEARAGAERSGGTDAPKLTPFRWLPHGPVGALAAKELTYYLREPSFRVALSRSSATLVVVGVLTFYPTNAPHFVWDSTLGVAGVLYSALWVLERACNQWGSESAAGRLLWGFPGDRRRWVLGKNAALLPLMLGIEGFFVGEYALIAHPSVGSVFSYLGYGALWLVNSVALGNVVSARLPFPTLGPAAQQNAGQSFGTGILYLGVGVVAGVLVSLPLPFLWTLALWGASVVWAGRTLERREPEVIEALE